MIYFIDRGFRVKSALNILINQCKYPGIYNECFCLICKINVNDGKAWLQTHSDDSDGYVYLRSEQNPPKAEPNPRSGYTNPRYVYTNPRSAYTNPRNGYTNLRKENKENIISIEIN